MKLPELKFDCKYFTGEKPCFANKRYGVLCDTCSVYEREDGLTEIFPEIREQKHLPGNTEKILIIKLDAVGDVLRTTSVLPSLKEKYPDAEIFWITKEKSFPVLQDNMLIDEIYFDSDDLEPLLCKSFDMAINLDSGLDSCRIMNRVIASLRLGYELINNRAYPINEFANEWFWMGIDDNFKKANIKTYHRLIHEICGLEYRNYPPSLMLSSQIQRLARQFNELYNIDRFSKFILINLGGGNRWQYKKWIKEGYIELINLLAEDKHCCVGIVAGNEDEDFYYSIEQEVDSLNNVIGFGTDNTTEQFIAIVSIASKVFTSDSLAFHIATALNKYVVVIVGPTSSTELDVFGNGKIIKSNKVDCLCCYLNRCDKSITCMNTVNAKEIFPLLK